MKKNFVLFSILVFLGLPVAQGNEPDWSAGFAVPVNGRANPYALPPEELQANIRAGRLHAQLYPVKVTGLLPPYQPVKNFIEGQTQDPFRFFLQKFFRRITDFRSIDDVMRWVGLNEYPKETDTGVYSVPFPGGVRPDYRMGLTLMEKGGAVGFTISCAECHSSRLFGKTVLGMTNRFANANTVFVKAKLAAHFLNPWSFQAINRATAEETELIREIKNNVRAVGTKTPLLLGLDTSLAQVALSLARRNSDAYATRSREFELRPRPEILESLPADSKPAVWWNLKYKNRWLSDGSIISGNPIYTNFLWNEIGRGVDLRELEIWLSENPRIIQELTTAVFSSEPPLFTDFFPAESINLQQARAGEILFNQHCARCHGHYEKAWNLTGAELLSPQDQLKTLRVNYPQPTRVKDVGTDPNRHRGMSSLSQLNHLEISKRHQIVIEPQEGYVPPPLVGIWARWPYFHNNSAPSLCAVLTAGTDRPQTYYAGPADNPQRDFDSDCNGYPVGPQVPESWKSAPYLFDSRREGLGNRGHDEGLFLENGRELLTPQQKRALIRYLQTL